MAKGVLMIACMLPIDPIFIRAALDNNSIVQACSNNIRVLRSMSKVLFMKFYPDM